MARFPGPFGLDRSRPVEMGDASAAVVAKFFNAVYAWMCVGMAVTAMVAFFTAQSPNFVVNVAHWWILLLVVEIGLIFGINSSVKRNIGAGLATALFLLFAAVNGLVLSSIFLVFALGTIASAFIITAGTFGVMSIYGMVTKRDLTSVGRIAIMAVVGIIIASIVSIFWHNTMLQVAINYIGVLAFVALTAYDTQRLRLMALQIGDDQALAARMSVVGSLVLYLDFINLFLFIVQIMGGSRRR